MFAVAKSFTDSWKAHLDHVMGQKHGDVPWQGQVLRALCRAQLTGLDSIVGGNSLNNTVAGQGDLWLSGWVGCSMPAKVAIDSRSPVKLP